MVRLFVYGTAAALVLGQLFFPAHADPLIGTIGAFAAFAIGFVARPLGGIVFGHIGDRYGRRASLVWTLLIMGFATFGIGLLPTYEHIGLAAPAALAGLRLLQGIASGGEWGGGVLMISENAPPEKRGYFAAWSQLGVGGGSFSCTSKPLTSGMRTSSTRQPGTLMSKARRKSAALTKPCDWMPTDSSSHASEVRMPLSSSTI
ncbi:MFS family permease [Paraburkholderia sp. JPY465]